jgi:hypothetical protein
LDVRLSYREGQFTPSEAESITGLSLTLQRDWRSQGYLQARTSGRASFSPREQAEMRVMVKLRGLGLPLAESREVADQAASSVLFAALADHGAKTLAVDAPPERAPEYLGLLERETSEGYLRILADLPRMEDLWRHVLLENGGWSLLRKIDSEPKGEDSEAAGLVNLWAIARAIAEAAPRALFTLVPPRSFRER